MDNASKALIMAGAILISIAIVGVGVFIFSSTSSITNVGSQQIDAAAAQTANSTIRQYTGSRVRGSTVKEFVEYIGTLNANDTYPYDLVVYVSGDDISGERGVAPKGTTDYALQENKMKLLNAITPNAYYTVEAKDKLPSPVDGYYDLVTIDPN